MKQASLICTFFILLVNVCESYRILGLFPLQSKSHMMMYERLMKGLAEKGHEVDVLSHFPLKNPPPRYNDLSVRGTLPLFVNNISVPYAREAMGSYFSILEFIINESGTAMCRAVLNSAAAKNLKDTRKKYDLVITEIFGSDCLLGFAYHFKAPVIGAISSRDMPWGSERIGNPDNPSYIPNYLTSFLPTMSLMERLENTLSLTFAKLRYHFGSLIPANEIAHTFFGNDLPDLRQMIHNFSLILVNSHFSTNFPRPAVPNFIEVGGLHITPSQPLSKYFEDLLNVPPQYKGVIYLSTGSLVLSETLPSYKLRAFFDAFKELPYKIIWKASRENIPGDLDIPSNIHFERWMPQADILCHPNVKLFVSHGGLMGTQEAIYCGVPRLGIPFFADQTLNLKASQALGLAIMVDYNNITKETILNTAKVLLRDEYKENAEKVSKLFKDRPLPPLETAIYWIEYVIRYKGAPHLKSVGAELSWYQYSLIDVAAIIITVSLLACFVIYYTVCYFAVRLFGKKFEAKSKSD